MIELFGVKTMQISKHYAKSDHQLKNMIEQILDRRMSKIEQEIGQYILKASEEILAKLLKSALEESSNNLSDISYVPNDLGLNGDQIFSSLIRDAVKNIF
jgi:hypothetical protein